MKNTRPPGLSYCELTGPTPWSTISPGYKGKNNLYVLFLKYIHCKFLDFIYSQVTSSLPPAVIPPTPEEPPMSRVQQPVDHAFPKPIEMPPHKVKGHGSDILASVQQGSFNFMQDSMLEYENCKWFVLGRRGGVEMCVGCLNNDGKSGAQQTCMQWV